MSQAGKNVSSLERACAVIARRLDVFRHDRAAVDRVKTTPKSDAPAGSNVESSRSPFTDLRELTSGKRRKVCKLV